MIFRFLPFVWKNAWRNKRRSILTLLGVAVAVFVYLALDSAVAGITFPLTQVERAEVLNVREAGRANVLSSRLPRGYVDRVAAVPGVASTAAVLDTLCVEGDKRVHIFIRGIESADYFRTTQVQIDPAARGAFDADRRALLVGDKMLRRMSWAVGDTVEVESIKLTGKVAGVIPPEIVSLESHLLMHLPNLQSLRGAENQVSYVLAAPSEGLVPTEVAAAIDRAFEHAPVVTKTASSQGFAEAIVADFLGFVDYLEIMGLLAVLITTAAAANSIAMNVRDRTREIGTLKAMGFPPRLVLSIVLAESALLGALGGVLGTLGAWAAVGNDAAALAGLVLPKSSLLVALILSLGIGAVVGFLPALNAARVKTIDALRVIG